jgi:uncharacterized membrane protein YgcG|tara:strand:- start:855 stop:1424 length:570 start_codon:yes stop_codon:yes gene_type:complete
MAKERLDLIKDVFNKAEYIKTINTSFSELGTTSITEDQQLQPTVEEFFGLYNSLFYDIPALGETNSHEYLVKTSGEYINFEERNEEIQALQAEIAQLRSDLLSAQINNIRTLAEPSESEQTNEALKVFEREIQAANENIIVTNTTLSQNTKTSSNSTGLNSGISGGGSSTGAASAGSSGGTSSGGGGGY